MPHPNRVLIGAIDHALNRLDRDTEFHRDIRGQQDKDYLADLKIEREALIEARTFIATNRQEDGL